ncbi:TonB-dependent receptor [Novosphingobium sp. 11B]
MSAAEAEPAVEDGAIVVTATRREMSLDKVPVKIDAFSQSQMDQRGMRSIDDISRYTPGLQFTNTGGVSGNTSNSISIRGISSDVGAATTAIYVDETPIQIRSVGYFGGNAFPRVFDLERVEVLKGPQGTLFGAGAEGGAVRFITPAPSLDKVSGYGRAEAATTDNGAPSYEVGAAIGAPLAQDLVGFRLSVSQRRDGGYIDRINAVTGDLVDKNANWQRTTVVRGALAIRPVPELTITPSLFFQKQYQPERNQYWEQHSDMGSADYRSGNTISEPLRDRFYLPAAKVQYSGDKIMIVSNTSWFDRRQVARLDYTSYLRAIRTGDAVTPVATLRPSAATVITAQRNFTQELRVQSQPGGPLDWVVGFYYSNQRQVSDNKTTSSNVAAATGALSYIDLVNSKDEQIAGFVNLDYHVADKLTLSAGVRVSQMKFSFTDAADGPVNGGPSYVEGSTKENPVTPKFAVAYQANPDLLVYANAAKGFRQGGAQGPVPAEYCASDLESLGIEKSPTRYDSDSVWSFDGGAKGTFMGGRMHLDANAYWIKWSNIQQPVNLPTCGFQYIANLGKANSRGLDLVLDFRLAPGLSVGGNLGFNRTTFAEDVEGSGGSLLAAKGERIGGPQWTGAVFGQVELPVSESIDAYLRADTTFRSKGVMRNEDTFSYDPGLTATKSGAVVSARLGAKMAAFDLSIFANNIFNDSKPLSRTHDLTGSALYYDFSNRPRTLGLTLTYRQ